MVGTADLLRPSGRPRIAITFDDGYADNLTVAAPVLSSLGLPATFFVMATDDNEREFWWDEIVHALAAPVACEFLEIDIGRRITIDVRTAPARQQAVAKLAAHLETSAADNVKRLLAAVYDQLGTEPARCAAHRRLDRRELQELSRLGKFDLGGHTRTHVALSIASEPDAMEEISVSYRYVADLLGRPPVGFAYPFGSLGRTVDPGLGRLVQRAGFKLAFTTQYRDVPRRFDPYLIPRINPGNISGSELATEVRRVMGI